MTKETYDVFLSHSHSDAKYVQKLAELLVDQEELKPWLDKWVVVPGGSFEQAITKGLEETKSCAVFLGPKKAGGWFEKEYEAALNRQAEDRSFRVIPVLLPGAVEKAINIFLKLNSWVDFREAKDFDYAFHLLKCGIKGVAPGRWPPAKSSGAKKNP